MFARGMWYVFVTQCSSLDLVARLTRPYLSPASTRSFTHLVGSNNQLVCLLLQRQYPSKHRMDPFSTTATILSVLDVALRTASAVAQYAHDTKGASTERRALAEEADCLAAILQRLVDRSHSISLDVSWFNTRKSVIQQFRRTYEELTAILKIDISTGEIKFESRLKAFRTSAKWSFNKSEVYTLIERISRLQQYAAMLLQSDQK